jgi:hypothetical protein
VDRPRGPFALWQGTNVSDGVIETRMLLSKSAELAGVLFRATAAGDGVRGCEIVLDPREERLALRTHAPEPTEVASSAVKIPIAIAFTLKIEFIGPRVRVWLGGGLDPVLDATDERVGHAPGAIGVRTWGGSVSLDDLTLRDQSRSGTPWRIAPADTMDPPRRALQAFCLLMLNLNETIYVD